MTDLRALVFRDHPTPVFVTASFLLSAISFTSTPSLVPIVLTLTALQLYARILLPGRNAFPHAVLLCLSLSFGGSVARLIPSLHALSSPGMSVVILFFLAFITSLITLGAIFLDTRLCMSFASPWSQLTFFPLVWAIAWCGVSYLSPVGRLVTLSPLQGLERYNWMMQWIGPAGNDWVAGAWAVVCSQAIGAWFIGSPSQQDEAPLITGISGNGSVQNQPRPPSNSPSVLYLAAFLMTLTIPSFVISDLPSPILSVDTTPLSVGCVLPSFQRYKHNNPTLDDLITESQKLTSSANILLWPEGAVTFQDEGDRNAGLERVREKITGSHVGVSFAEILNNASETSGRHLRRTGIALVSNTSSDILLMYHKRHLVPIAESFSFIHSMEPPIIRTLNLSVPRGIKKPDWAPAPNYTRPIPLTASICLDFAAPSAFAELDSRPALILGPARTWHTSVGYAMWQQAKQRADEIDSMVLWCDGGEGGVSGIAGRGLTEVSQVGGGSWVRTIAIQWPFEERQTAYARFGDFYTMLLFCASVLGGWISTLGYPRVTPGIRGATSRVQGAKNAVQRWWARRRIAHQGELEHGGQEDLLSN